MPHLERFTPVAPLPPHGEWRRVLALDRGAGVARPVALSFLPASVVDDPARLAAVVRDVEAAGRLHHPGVVAVLGLETVGDAPAVVEALVPGVTLRALLDAAGRLPADLAARIAVDVCAAVARAHGLDAGDGRPLVHGAIAPSRIVVGEDGAARLAGLGEAGGCAPADDVRALGAMLHECLAGEPAGDPPRALDAPGVPPGLAAAVSAATGAAGAPPPSAAALAQVIVAAGSVASHADVAAYAEVILPAGEGARGELDRALAAAVAGTLDEVSAELIVDPEAFRRAPAPVIPPRPARPAAPPAIRAHAEPTPEPLPRPPSTRPGADPAGVFAAPAPFAARSRVPAAVALVCLVAGFGGGFLAARRWVESQGSARAAVAAEPPEASPSASGAAPLLEAPAAAAAPAQGPRPPGAAASAAATRPARATKAQPKPKPRPPARAARGAAPAVTPGPTGSGVLDVSAPAEAEVFLDGRRIGRGGLRVDVAAGAHRIEVRLGESRVAERFELAPGETWTYEVTPTP